MSWFHSHYWVSSILIAGMSTTTKEKPWKPNTIKVERDYPIFLKVERQKSTQKNYHIKYWYYVNLIQAHTLLKINKLEAKRRASRQRREVRISADLKQINAPIIQLLSVDIFKYWAHAFC